MVLFVDLDEEEAESVQGHGHHLGLGPEWRGDVAKQTLQRQQLLSSAADASVDGEQAAELGGVSAGERENPNRNVTTEALGCYPIVMAVASSLDLNTLDNLSRTCRQVRQGLLAYRDALVGHTLHCVNEDRPVDPDSTLRYRARAGNWYYMEDASRSPSHSHDGYSGKSGSCARDLVAACRRCARVVCRNCAIKPPAPAALRNRHRRLCLACTKAPLAALAQPPLRLDTPASAPELLRAVCTCDSEGVWLCQPCGRGILGDDQEYKTIWKWRNQYGERLGGLGTGIGEGDRGVPCGRHGACCGAKACEQETDCDAADARELSVVSSSSVGSSPSPPSASPLSRHPTQSSHSHSHSRSPSSPLFSAEQQQQPHWTQTQTSTLLTLRPGYARHEIEGIGGVVKTKLVRMLRVGACVPEWDDERARGEILAREVDGRARSWCGWCGRAIPGAKDRERERDGGGAKAKA